MKPESVHLSSSRRLRHRIASEAARIMVEEGVQDYRLAKDKAMRHLALGAHDGHGDLLPSNAEIMEEVVLRLRLFQRDSHAGQLRELRVLALELMDLLQAFEPRLVGPVLEGVATAWSDLHLHLFADTPESVFFFMMEQGIPYQEDAQSLRFGQGYREVPVLRFDWSGVPVHAAIFALDAREAPVSAMTGKTMRRARRKQVEALLQEALDVPSDAEHHVVP